MTNLGVNSTTSYGVRVITINPFLQNNQVPRVVLIGATTVSLINYIFKALQCSHIMG
jgi:hypothetical protein